MVTLPCECETAPGSAPAAPVEEAAYEVQETYTREAGHSSRHVMQEEQLLLNKADAAWLEKLRTTVVERGGSSNFNVEFLASEMAVTRQYLTRKIKRITGKTALEYLKEYRLIHALRQLESGMADSVKEVALNAGFSDPGYFSRQFKQRFKRLPSSFLVEP